MPEFSYNNQVVVLKSGGVDCILNGDMMQLLGFSFSRPALVQEFWKTNEKIQQEIEYQGVTSPNLFLFQPQELVINSNIVVTVNVGNTLSKIYFNIVLSSIDSDFILFISC